MSTNPTLDQKESSQRYVFSAMWAIAVLFHYRWDITYGQVLALYPSYALSEQIFRATGCILACFLLLNPKSTLRLVLLLFALCIDVFYHLPEVPNHWLLAGIVSASYLVLLAKYERLGRHVSFAYFRTTSFWIVGIFYFFTFFWKLNTGFLNPTSSCGVQFYQNILLIFPLPSGTSVNYFVIWSTLLIEMAIPLLLVIPKTRPFAAVLAVIFHTAVGFDPVKGFSNFSAIMFALIMIVVHPSRYKTLLLRREFEFLSKTGVGKTIIAAYWAVVLIAHVRGPYVALEGMFFLWLIYETVSLAVVLCVFFDRTVLQDSLPLSALALIFPLLVALNGICPLLGVKNRSAWQMYSNLRLENDYSNHLLVGPSLDLLNILKDRVKVSVPSSNYPYVTKDTELPRLELLRLTQVYPKTDLSYNRLDDKIEDRSFSWFEFKFLWFQEFGEGVEAKCIF